MEILYEQFGYSLLIEFGNFILFNAKKKKVGELLTKDISLKL